MSDAADTTLHPLATTHLPPFVAAPGETDVLLVATVIFLVLAVVGIGVFYFRLHSLPEQLAHKGQKVQFEIVAVLGLLALFTHNHLFWIAGLLLALVPMPDFSTPLTSMAQSLGKIARGPDTSQVGRTLPSAGIMAVALGDETTPGGTSQVSVDTPPPKATEGV